MIRVTLEFATVEETILALGKMSALGKARRAANAPAPQLPGAGEDAPAAPPSAAVPPAPAGRKGRSDAGKPRGPYRKGAGEGSLPDANTGQAPAGSVAPAPSPAAPPEQPAAPETESPAQVAGKDHKPDAAGSTSTAAPDAVAPSAVPSIKDVQTAVGALFEAKGIEVALSTLAKFGVKRAQDVKEADRAAFIAATKEAML